VIWFSTWLILPINTCHTPVVAFFRLRLGGDMAIGHVSSTTTTLSPLSPGYFTSLAYPDDEQFDAWREFMSDAIEICPTESARRQFGAEIYTWCFGEYMLTRAVFLTGGPRVLRHWPRSFHDHWVFPVMRDNVPGAAPVRRTIDFRSLALPFGGIGTSREVLSLLIPRQALPTSLSFDQARDVVIGSPFAGVLADLIERVVDQIPTDASAETKLGIAHAFRGLTQLCLDGSADRGCDTTVAVTSALFERARRVVVRNMASPSFGPDELCRLLASSRSKLYRQFEPVGGLARFIQQVRLEEARRRLTSDGAPQSIHRLAEELGFLDHSTFSRAFKRAYGYSPSEARQQVQAPSPVGSEDAASPSA
jgi:AraC-like DNA-binding protein